MGESCGAAVVAILITYGGGLAAATLLASIFRGGRGGSLGSAECAAVGDSEDCMKASLLPSGAENPLETSMEKSRPDCCCLPIPSAAAEALVLLSDDGEVISLIAIEEGGAAESYNDGEAFASGETWLPWLQSSAPTTSSEKVREGDTGSTVGGSEPSLTTGLSCFNDLFR